MRWARQLTGEAFSDAAPELGAQAGKLLWKRPVGAHSGHDNDRLITEYATPTSPIPLPAAFNLEPSSPVIGRHLSADTASPLRPGRVSPVPAVTF
jgi:hypothetical protein